MLIIVSLIGLTAIVTYFYMRQPKFGQLPKEKRLERIQQSPHYKDGKFRNLVEKPTISAGYSIIGEIYKTFVRTIPNKRPDSPLPSVKTNLKTLPRNEDVLVWFGHSSFFLKVNKTNILVDPVFSGSTSPIPGSVKAYKGTDIYKVEDLPKIDYLLISHDHYDHMDYKTVLKLRTKVSYVICGLGVGAHFEYWGFSKEKIIEQDWGGKVSVKNNFNIYTESIHHASGRGFSSNKELPKIF
ncbi:MBL fold metallo-hydrolase [uncultured Salegentibacter sp.]|uniref:MBL fold metallo-hydrolase n=1 Tax=uncultured Salegentibacter sp. TaxID=259320 RepID=UPI0030DC5C80